MLIAPLRKESLTRTYCRAREDFHERASEDDALQLEAMTFDQLIEHACAAKHRMNFCLCIV